MAGLPRRYGDDPEVIGKAEDKSRAAPQVRG